MRWEVTDNNVRITDSYEVGKADMETVLYRLKYLYPNCRVWKRTMRSLRREWACHNLLYRLHIARSRTKDVDLDYPQGWGYRIGYSVLGTVALLIIK